MKSLVELLEDLLQDCGRRSAAPVTRDVETLRLRVKHEGDGFITITLPAFCKDFERSLDLGRIAPGSFSSFQKWKAGIPAFMQGFLRNVFDKEGSLLPEPSIDCIRSIRQICLFGKKVQRPCSSARLEAAIEGYKKCDDECVANPDNQLSRWFDATARVIMNVLKLDDLDFEDEIEPRHGPGATAEGITGNGKYTFERWHDRLSEVGFTHSRYAVPAAYYSNWPSPENVENASFPTRAQYDGLAREYGIEDMPTFIAPEDEQPVRVVFVPKTLKTPRVIAVEPVCMQYAQQGLSRFLMKQLDHCFITSNHVEFRDQGLNQALASKSSQDCRLATLDMKEASDRVSLAIVGRLFAAAPDFLEWVLAARSTTAELPNGEVIPLRKFASMGSALCFPVEALVFFTSIIASRLHRAGIFPTTSSVYSSGRDVYVFGDDLIVPTGEAAAICEDLETMGFRVNRNKSFWTGKFRESCGADCYDGERVDPIYLRRDLPTSRRDVSGLLSAVATSNQLWSAGYYVTATAIKKAVEQVFGRLPEVPADSPAIGWNRPSEFIPPERSNVDLQRRESLCYVALPSRVDDPLEGYAALAKCLGRIRGIPSYYEFDSFNGVDAEHLVTSPRRYSLTLKRSWVPLRNA